MNPAEPILAFEGISKSFSGTPVLKGITFSLGAGRTVGLVGENGAGKSTLMNVLGGNLRPDRGHMRLDSGAYEPRTPRDAARQGIAFIHQELNLFGNLTIAENLFLTEFPRTGRLPLIDRQELRRRAVALMEQVGLELPPDTLVDKLSAGEQQLVEIAKALGIQARIIIFDEPTTSLTSRETERLFALIKRLQSRGLSLIYISHQIGDVMRLCADIAVLRDGELVAFDLTSAFTLDRLVSLMVGRNLTQIFPTRSASAPGEPLLEVRKLSQPGIIADITFTLRRGEILGIAGLMGSGRSELARILHGLDPFTRGEVWLKGRRLTPEPGRNVRRGLAFLTENRREEGLCLNASLAENMALVTLPDRAHTLLGLLDRSGLRQAIDRIRAAVRLAPSAGNQAPVRILSGGNQQKVVLAKWLLAEPSVFILDEPTRGIDVGAKAEIYQLISDLAARGAGLLVISSEIEELIGLCERILVMNRGEIADELRRGEFNRERILVAALSDRKPAVAPPPIS